MTEKSHKHVYVVTSTQTVDEGRTIKTVKTCRCGDTITDFRRNPHKDR